MGPRPTGRRLSGINLPLPDGSEAADDATGKLGRSRRVLLVDDEPVSRGVLSSYLAGDGHQVVTAVDAEQAMSLFALGEFDLVITDHAMPGMNGLQLAATVREKLTGASAA